MLTFGEPTQFSEAIAYLRGKQLMPTTLSSAELQGLDAELKQRSVFSATVTDADFLDEFDTLVTKIAGGPDEADFAARAAGTKPLLVSVPQAKADLLDYLKGIGYEPEPENIGTVKDLRTNARLQLIVETNVLDTMGFGRYASSQNVATLTGFPAWELVRMRYSKVPRNWIERWAAARQATSVEGSTEPDSGRLIALKDHPLWKALGDGAGGYEDTLGNPWPPFAFNSGMNVIDVSREEAVELGLCKQATKIEPQPMPRLNENMQASVKGFATALQGALEGGGYKIKDGVLMANQVVAARARIGAFLGELEETMLANDNPNVGSEPRDAHGRWEPGKRAEAVKGLKAINEIGKTHQDIPAAMNVEDIGPVDFRWQVGPRGMRRVLEDHKIARRIPIILAKGTLTKGQTRAFKDYRGHRVVLSNNLFGAPANHWVLTGYRNK